MTALLEAPVSTLTDVEPYRVIVTGARDWPWSGRVWAELIRVFREDVAPGQSLIVVHGCAAGADSHAKAWALGMKRHGYPVSEEGHPADWERFGKMAGFHRNTEMAELGAALCLAFVLPCGRPRCRIRRPHDSHGTADMLRNARGAGIEVRRIEARHA